MGVASVSNIAAKSPVENLGNPSNSLKALFYLDRCRSNK